MVQIEVWINISFGALLIFMYEYKVFSEHQPICMIPQMMYLYATQPTATTTDVRNALLPVNLTPHVVTAVFQKLGDLQQQW